MDDLFNSAATGFRLYGGNRLEELSVRLGELIGEGACGDPLRPGLVVVQSRGMARYLSMALAENSGIAANLDFPFPRGFFQEYIWSPICEAVCGKRYRDRDWHSPEILRWRIAAQLPELIQESPFVSLRKYLDGEDHMLKMVQLSARVAALFDRYLIYRPDLINAWDRGYNPLPGADAAWQCELWRRVGTDAGGLHPAFFYRVLIEQLYPGLYPPERRIFRGTVDFSRLQDLKQVFFFGFSCMAPLYLDAVFAMARLVRVDFFHLNPCAEYWEYNRPYRMLLREKMRKTQTRVMAAAGEESVEPEVELSGSAMECANPLLGSWGEQGREFFALIASGETIGEEMMFGCRDTGTLLERLQDDIRDMSVNPEGNCQKEPDDGSIRIHSCHGKMREVEVLYENMLAMFASCRDLRPEDVMVLVPDINSYAPYIEAVFRTVPRESPKWFHVTIADRVGHCGGEAEAFFNILTADRDRFRSPVLLDILEVDAVRRRFDIDDADLSRLRLLLAGYGINWGIDGAYRKSRTGCDFSCNSWRFGLDRMLTGFAMKPDYGNGDEIWHSPAGAILPGDDIEGDGALLLGRLCDFFARLTRFHELVGEYEKRRAPLEKWYALLAGAIDDFFLPGAADDGVQALRDALENWFEEMRRGTGTGGLPLDVAAIVYCLREHLDDVSGGGGFLQGGVTFCQAKPLRSIPARVICMLGMDETAFPRPERRLNFDLTAVNPRPGDRSSRGDDRYLFLETLLSAREIFYLSYVGGSTRENTERPPCVMVSELIEYIADHYTPPRVGEPVWQRRQRMADTMIIRHPLQAFSPRYFTGETLAAGRLISYSEENLAAAEAMRRRRAAVPSPETEIPSITCEIPCEDTAEVISLDDLAGFFKNPARIFCRERLGIRIGVDDNNIPRDREPFALERLVRYGMADEILRRCLTRGMAAAEVEAMAVPIRETAAATGQLPAAAQGEIAFESFWQEFKPYAGQITETVETALPPVCVDIPFAEPAVVLQVRIDSIYRCRDKISRQTFFRFGKLGAADEIFMGIYHLALGLDGLRDQPSLAGVEQSVFFGRDCRALEMASPASPESAAAGIRDLLKLYLDGRRRPLEFHPEASWKCAALLEKNIDGKTALEKVRSTWGRHKNEYVFYDEYLRFCFGDAMPENELFLQRFLDNARRVRAAISIPGGGG